MKKILKKVVPHAMKNKIRQCVKFSEINILNVFSSSTLLTRFYYSFLNDKYLFEQNSVLKGRYYFHLNSKNPSNSSPQLRRNTHRLEKGLCMSPRKNIFAEAYILETVELYGNCLQSEFLCNEELYWAKDILDEYFSVIGESEITLLAKKRYLALDCENSLLTSERETKYTPYMRSSGVKSDVSYDDLTRLCQQRRSVRWYTEEKVKDDDIDRALEVARLAPSACNRQPFEFLVINNAKLAQEIASLANGTAGFSEQIRTLVLVVGDLSCYPTEADRHVIYIDSALASMQFMLALESLGLSSCPINWPEIEQKEIELRKEIQLPKHKRVIMMISIGYADPLSFIPFSAKKSVKILKTSPEII